MEPDYLEDLKTVLCDPEGVVAIKGSEMDREIIQRCLRGLEKKLADLDAAVAKAVRDRTKTIAFISTEVITARALRSRLESLYPDAFTDEEDTP